MLLLYVGALVGCQPLPPRRYDDSWRYGPGGSDAVAGREWFSASVVGVDRRASLPGSGADGIGDGFGLTLGGGYDLVGDPLRLAFEGELGWTLHDTDWMPIDPDDGDNVALFLGSMGLRLWLRPGPSELLSPYLRIGGFGRWLWDLEDVDEGYAAKPAGVAETVWGVYYGAGLQFRFAPGSYFGPYALYLDGLGDERDVDELLIGLGSTFRF